MGKYYCMYCGTPAYSISSLTNGRCEKNPDGKYHVLYEGDEKSKYTCKYCGTPAYSISSLSNGICGKNPNGKSHVPAR